MNIWITGDIHGNIDDLFFRIKSANAKDGYLIQLGDFGILWDGSRKEKRRLEYIDAFLETRNLKIIFVAGNHENYDVLYKYKITEESEGFVRRVKPLIFQVPNGNSLTLFDKKFLFIGGARSTDKYFRTDHVDWWPQELSNFQESTEIIKNAEEIKEVDYVITHTAPRSVVETFDKVFPEKCSQQELLEEVKNRIYFKKWYFGHFHVDEELVKDYFCLYEKIIKLGE